MLQLVGPYRVAKRMAIGDQEAVVALYMREPDEEWFREFFEVEKMKPGPKKEKRVEALMAPERIAPFVERWEGVAGLDEEGNPTPAPCVPEAVVAACEHKAFYLFLVEAMRRSVARVIEGNSEALPGGSTGEARADAGPAAAAGKSEG